MRNPKTAFMARQERAMMQHSLERPIRDGEIAYDVANDWFFNQRYSFLLTDEEQALVRQWQREGRIVVEGETVRMRVR